MIFPSIFAPSSQVNNLLLLSGFAGWDKDGHMSEGIILQTELTLRNIMHELEKHGLDETAVLRVRCYVTNMNDWPTVRSVLEEYFSRGLPAATVVGVTALAQDWMEIEIESDCVARQ